MSVGATVTFSDGRTRAETTLRLAGAASKTILYQDRFGVSWDHLYPEAIDVVVEKILVQIRRMRPLSATVAEKNGRWVTLDRGAAVGIERDSYFALCRQEPRGREDTGSASPPSGMEQCRRLHPVGLLLFPPRYDPVRGQ